MKQILIILLTIFFIFYLCIHLNFYYYSSPYINFENLKEISGIINKINKAVKESIKTENNIKISFINTYGSNYVRNNNIPNNLVQEIQFDLGDFYYNEENINEIAIEINNKINKIRSNLYKTLK